MKRQHGFEMVWSLLGLLAAWTWAGLGQAGEPSRPDKPWWEGSQAGLSDRVLSPWVPVEAAENQVKVWGRTYQFGPLPFPSGVETRQKQVLSGPITLRGTVEGQEIQWTGGPYRVVESKDSQVRWTGQADTAGLHCEGRITVEYDGLVRCDLVLRPKQGPVTVQELALEMPLKAEHAKYFHFYPGRWGSADNSRSVPPEGYQS